MISSKMVIGIYHSYIIAAGGVKVSNGRDGNKNKFIPKELFHQGELLFFCWWPNFDLPDFRQI